MSEDVKYRHVVRAVAETPWAIMEQTLLAILEMVELRASGGHYTAEEIQARIGNGPARRSVYTAGPVAILPLYGVIVPRADLFTEISGGTSAETFAADLEAAVSDDDVKGIVLDVASPGGQTALMPETAARMRALRGTKPIVAVANTVMGSAAYWLASQADEIVGSPSSDLGSIGVFGVHEDISAMQEMIGRKTSLIVAKDAPYKTELTPFAPLSEEARSAAQERVDEEMAVFVSDVAKGRGVSVDTVKRDFGRGRMLSAQKAVAAGMADRIETLDETVARVANPHRRARIGRGAQNIEIQIVGKAPPDADTDTTAGAAESGLSFADAADAALRALDAVVTGSEALRALTGRKREQLAALIERGQQVLAETEEATDQEAADTRGHELELAWQLAPHI